MGTERLAQPINFGKYELVGRIAHGRMGDAYKAKSHGVEGFEKIFVVKIFHQALTVNPAFVDAVIEEAKRTVTLAHANVAQVFDLGLEEQSGQYYVAQEYVSGLDLGHVLKAGQRTGRTLPQEVAVFVCGEICKGVDYAHRRKDYNFNNLNLVHGDLKPENVLVSFDGDVKITDFGMGRALKMTPELSAADQAARHLYAAPEVAQGQQPTQRSDVFSLGLMMYELITGTHPYADANPAVVKDRAARAEIRPLSSFPDVPRAVASVVDSILVPDPSARMTSAGQVYEELAAYIFGNNLRADTRALAVHMQELKRAEQRKGNLPESTTEFGLQEISLAEIQVLGDDPSNVSDATNAELPSYKIAQAIGKDARPPLPGALEEIFLAVRGGRGKAVLVSGNLGQGRHHLADRLKDAVSWRGNATAQAVQVCEDDRYTPFGVLSDVILASLECEQPEQALDRLRDAGLADDAVATLAGIWSLNESRNQGSPQKTTHLLAAFQLMLSLVTKAGPFALVLDRIDRVDAVSLDVLREVVGTIGQNSCMLVMCTDAPEQMRQLFDIGRPENLEAIHVSGEQTADLSAIRGLSDDAARVLTTLAIAGIPLDQTDLNLILQMPVDRVVAAARDLTDKGLIRTPETGVFLTGLDNVFDWVLATLRQNDIEALAGIIERHFKHRRRQERRFAPTMLRLSAVAGNRRDMVSAAQAHAHWLENQGWFDTALEFYQAAADLIASNRLGAPHSRIGFLLNRAELALQLSRLETSRAALEPVASLSETIRSDVGAIRGQLLLGQMAMQQDDLAEAHACFKRAVDAAGAINDPDLLALGMLALARWHDRYGDPVSGQRMLDGAMNLFQRWGTFRMDLNTRALLLNRAVRLFASRGMELRARQLLGDLLAMADRNALPVVRCRATWAEASVAQAAKDWARAQASLEEARKIATIHGLTALGIELLGESAAAALDAQDYERAIALSGQLIDEGLAYQDFFSAQRGQDITAIASCMLGRNIEQSLQHLQTSLKRSEERDVPRDMQRCHDALGKVYRALRKPELAQQHEDAAKTIASRLRYHLAA